MQEKDKNILNLQHEINELKYDLHDKDLDMRDQEEEFLNKLNSVQKVGFGLNPNIMAIY